MQRARDQFDGSSNLNSMGWNMILKPVYNDARKRDAEMFSGDKQGKSKYPDHPAARMEQRLRPC